jgi:hypothetical protein
MVRCHSPILLLRPIKGMKKKDDGIPEWEATPKVPFHHARSLYVGMRDVSLFDKWHDGNKDKLENQETKIYARASKPPDTSRVHQPLKRYPNIEEIKWSKKCSAQYEKGKPFLPTRYMQRMPRGMKRFHDWYL